MTLAKGVRALDRFRKALQDARYGVWSGTGYDSVEGVSMRRHRLQKGELIN